MKHNLKNRPLGGTDYREWALAMATWFDEFEAELREMKDKRELYAETWNVIREILGEEAAS